MKHITAIIATRAKDMEEFSERPIFKSLQKQHDVHDLYTPVTFKYKIIFDNQLGLSKVYNTCLQDPAYKNHILLFLHDDVVLEDIFLAEKVINSPYSVTGLAGTRSADLKKAPAWYIMSEKADWVGEVAHTKDNKTWTTCFGETDSRALLLDGLFLAVDVNVVNKAGVAFDEDFDFHHYDITFCLDCNKKKIKVGVQPIRVVHCSLGRSVNTPEWRTSAIKFSKKYSNG